MPAGTMGRMDRYPAPPAFIPGDYFVVRTGSFVGRAIRVLTRSRHNHAGVIVDLSGTTVEAFPSGAALGNLARYRRVVVSRLDLSAAQRPAVVAAAHELVGRPYGFLDILALGLLQFGIRWGWLTARVSDSTRLVCSQLVDLAYETAGVHLFADGRSYEDVTPGDLAEVLLDPSGVTTDEAKAA